MKRKKPNLLELAIILLVVACVTFGLREEAQTKKAPVEKPATKKAQAEKPLAKQSPRAAQAGEILPPLPDLDFALPLHYPESHLLFRWSTTGGCYSDSSYFFELRADQGGGADWTALLCQYSRCGKVPNYGNFYSSGTLTAKETASFIESMEAVPVWGLKKDAVWNTGEVDSLRFKLGKRSHRAKFQDEGYLHPEYPHSKVTRILRHGFPSDAKQSLEARVKRGDKPDRPLCLPGAEWGP